MDIQRDEAFEAAFEKTNFHKGMVESLKNSDCPFTSVFEMRKGKYRSSYIQLASEIWQAAKAQTVPKGFVLVPKVFPEEKALNLAKQKTEEQSKRIDDKFRHGIEYSENKKASISRDKLGAMKNLHTDFFLMIDELEQKIWAMRNK